MKLFIEKDDEDKEISFEGTADELLKKLKINPETCIIVKNNEIITEEESINDYDEVKILSVISGG